MRGMGGHLVFRIEHKLGRGRSDLSSCQVSLNSVHRFQRRSQKYLSQSEAGVAIWFFFRLARKKNLVEDVEFLLAVKFRQILISDFRAEVEINQSEAGMVILFFRLARKTQTEEDVEFLLPVKYRQIPFSQSEARQLTI